jgi:hypothetical protein
MEAVSKASDLFSFTHIAYLAATVSIEDYEDALFPYLTGHPNVQFCNLMLHPIIERGEYELTIYRPGACCSPGSTHYFANQERLLHRRVGRDDNCLRALHDTPLCKGNLCESHGQLL